MQGESIKLWAAQPIAAQAGGLPGTVVAVGADGVDVACGTGALRVTQLQRPGGRRLAAADFLRGFPLQPGARFA